MRGGYASGQIAGNLTGAKSGLKKMFEGEF